MTVPIQVSPRTLNYALEKLDEMLKHNRHTAFKITVENMFKEYVKSRLKSITQNEQHLLSELEEKIRDLTLKKQALEAEIKFKNDYLQSLNADHKDLEISKELRDLCLNNFYIVSVGDCQGGSRDDFYIIRARNEDEVRKYARDRFQYNFGVEKIVLTADFMLNLV